MRKLKDSIRQLSPRLWVSSGYAKLEVEPGEFFVFRTPRLWLDGEHDTLMRVGGNYELPLYEKDRIADIAKNMLTQGCIVKHPSYKFRRRLPTSERMPLVAGWWSCLDTCAYLDDFKPKWPKMADCVYKCALYVCDRITESELLAEVEKYDLLTNCETAGLPMMSFVETKARRL